jgi:micrococcal nuclease
MKNNVLNILLFLLIFSDSSCAYPPSKDSIRKYLPVKEVVDGDTFRVDDGSEKGLKIRLIGVDAPESRKTGRKEIGYYGEEAKQFLTHMLTGKRVRLEYDVERLDMYGRTLAYVYLENNTFVNAELMKHGYAMVMTVPPNVKYAEKFIKLQKKAIAKNRGLWGKTENEKEKDEK